MKADGRAAALEEMGGTGVVQTPTVAEVDLGKLRKNLDVFRAAGAEVMGVVKANAYGHGAVPVARALADAGVEFFAVATVPEGIELRRADIPGRILILAAPLPEYLPAYAKHDLDVTVSSPEVAEFVVSEAGRGRPLRAHVKVDTGMGRIGVSVAEAESVVTDLDRSSGVTIAGLWTHFATSDDPDLSFTFEQLERFKRVVDRVGDVAETIHTANSAAALRVPESYGFERSLVRAGIGLYGYTDLDGLAEASGLQPVMRVTSRVTHAKWVEAGTTVSYGRKWKADRRSRILTVGAGYADGYPRLATNRAEVGIGGHRLPVAGTVCMDMFMVNAGGAEGFAPGDAVVLFGDGGPGADELGAWAETISYEILTSVAPRVPRIYMG